VHHFGSVSGSAVASLIFGGMAIVLGVVIATIARRLEAARTGLVIGAAVSLVLAGVVWLWLWSGFYSLTVVEGTVRISYRMPSRERTLRLDQIARVRWVPGPKGTRSLVIATVDGRVYRSTNTAIQPGEMRRVEQTLAPR
jgi:hypothetical protein